MSKLHGIVRRVNVVHIICNHLFSEGHNHRHRMCTGLVMMVFGVWVAKSAVFFPYEIVAYMGDGVGYMIHGLGLAPFIEFLLEKSKQEKQL